MDTVTDYNFGISERIVCRVLSDGYRDKAETALCGVRNAQEAVENCNAFDWRLMAEAISFWFWMQNDGPENLMHLSDMTIA